MSPQIKLMKILGYLGHSDRQYSEHMYAVLGEVLRRGDSHNTIGMKQLSSQKTHALVVSRVVVAGVLYQEFFFSLLSQRVDIGGLGGLDAQRLTRGRVSKQTNRACTSDQVCFAADHAKLFGMNEHRSAEELTTIATLVSLDFTSCDDVLRLFIQNMDSKKCVAK